MANSVTTSLPPTTYLGSRTINLVLAGNVQSVSYTVNDIQPALSEYIAYDTLTPPNPFIAVTQDGKGRVVYDGGFPKFQNAYQPAPGTPFSDLTGSYKFLYNALKWVANPVKTAAGNNKILFLGDRIATDTYAIKGTTDTGFATSIANICSIAGFVPTLKDISDYAGGKLNCTLAELDAYCAVVMFSTAYDVNNIDLITQSAINDLLTYRSNGNGLIFSTDHGDNAITSVNQIRLVPDGVGYYATANRVIANFGAFFSGNYDRSSVNVGFLRSTYGDHPLYNGMADIENIFAGLSESRVVVATYPMYTPGNVPSIPMIADGRYTIRVLARLSDGTVETFQYVFAIVSGAVVEVKNVGGTVISSVDTGFADNASVYPVIYGAGLGTLSGQVTVQGVKVANMLFTEAGGSVVTWLDGTRATRVNDGDVIRAEITSPFTYYADVTVTRIQPDISTKISPASVAAILRPYFTPSAGKGTIQLAMETAGLVYNIDYGRNAAALATYLKRT